MRSRGRRTLSLSSTGRARDQQSARTERIPLRRGRRSSGDVAAGAPDALPRHGLRQHLGERTGLLDGVGIEHAVASLRHRVAGLDPDRRVASGSGE